MKKQRFDALVVITPKDFKRLLNLYPRLIDNFLYGKVYFVSAPETGEIIDDSNLQGKAFVLDENSLIPFDAVHFCIREKMKNILAGRDLPRGITGWYYQQFLKMQYAYSCQDEYYMVWDGDTIPCKEINMFQEESGKPYFDMKHEYHAEYFETMGVLLPGFSKVIERSFISEHMLFRVDIMRKLIEDIEANDKIPGTRFWEKIINAIPEDKIQASAFSEFETYGTYTAMKFVNAYKLREWHSFRQGGTFFKINTISDRDFNWLSRDFDAISFEKGHEVREDNANLFDNPYYQEKLTPKQMLQAAQLEYTEGYKEVWEDDKEAAKANISRGSFNQDEDTIVEDRLKYLSNDTYKIYEGLGDELIDNNANKAYLCYENAEFLCDDQVEKARIKGKKEKLYNSGLVAVQKTAIVILSYNNTYCLRRCIESIYTNCNPESYMLIIFDNGSTDGSSEWLAEWGEKHDEAYVILNDTNLGFPAGNNAACQYLQEGMDVFYLNNDTRLPTNALFWLRMGLYESDEVGAVGAMQNYAYADQLEDVEFNLPEEYVEYGASINVPMDNALEEQTKICGFAMLVKREVYDKVGGFNEAYGPGYLEDDELSFRIRELGYKMMVCHNAFIYHAGGQSFRKRDDVPELFELHRKIFVANRGFDSTIEAALSVNELAFVKSLSEKGYKKEDSFTLVHVGCGCGNMLGRIHYEYPNAQLYGVEENDNARKFALPFIRIYKQVEDLPMPLDQFDVVGKGLG